MTSSMGPITRKARTGAKPKLERSEDPIKASASLQRDSRKDKTIKRTIASSGVALIDVRIRVGTYTWTMLAKDSQRPNIVPYQRIHQ